ncbi:hypothetical protein PGTUg99_030408 [Puccinia graminis f. sp. tritici]|uniref:Uncharacterized protein n=1 Tax=Puccinia graminis f. sp. tritici TaxID=56615 RepID=A0A5B0SEB9_PUCGR|nr:hypothetical protein PGTUg99_030408 [Puccinia graminis f. sp. tritici]
MSGWRRTTFFFLVSFKQSVWDFPSYQAAPVLDQTVEQMAAGHWLPGDVPLHNVEDVGDLGLDSSGNRLQSDHTQFGWTHPFEGFLPQLTYDDEETAGIFSSAIPSFDNYNSGLETTHSSEGEHDHQPTHQQKAYEADAGSVEDQINYEIDHIPLNPTNEEDDKCIENFFRNAKNFRLKNIEHPLLNEFVERVTQKYESVCHLRSIRRISKAFRFENMPVIENNGFMATLHQHGYHEKNECRINSRK